MLKILHTADWHIGKSFDQFGPEAAATLARDRLGVIDRIMGCASQFDVDAVLCAGDLFDRPDPDDDWWKGLAAKFDGYRNWRKPVVLLPGNHDPLTDKSVYDPSHGFRKALPEWVHVVDRDDFQMPIASEGIVYATPCRSTAGDKDLAMSLPRRITGDTRFRIGLVHGSTFEMEGYETHFPVSISAPRERGLDYLAIGDTHSFQTRWECDPAPIVYPGAPEATAFKEKEAGYVAVVSFRKFGTKPTIHKERVARWTWQERTITSLAELEGLLYEDLDSTVLNLVLSMTVDVTELDFVDEILSILGGTKAMSPRVGVLRVDRDELRIDDRIAWPADDEIPLSVRETIRRLRAGAQADPVAQRSLVIFRRLLHRMML